MEKYVNLPTFLILALLSRILVTGASIGESIALLSLSGLYSYFLFLESKKSPKANQELWNRVIELEEQLKLTRDKVNTVHLSSVMKRQ